MSHQTAVFLCRLHITENCELGSSVICFWNRNVWPVCGQQGEAGAERTKHVALKPCKPREQSCKVFSADRSIMLPSHCMFRGSLVSVPCARRWLSGQGSLERMPTPSFSLACILYTSAWHLLVSDLKGWVCKHFANYDPTKHFWLRSEWAGCEPARGHGLSLPSVI